MRDGAQAHELPPAPALAMAMGEIAAVMDLPEGTVKSHLFRARKLLKEKLVARYGPEGT